MLSKIERFLFYLLVFLIPTQLGYHFWPDWAFVFGVRVDYLAPTLYSTDVLLILLVAIARTKIKTTYLFGFLSFAFINIIISVSPWASILKWAKILEIIFFAKYVYDNISLVRGRRFFQVVSASLILTSVLGIAQFLKGETLGGIFYLIGERTFNLNTPGIALQEVGGVDYLRAYSTFSHPNSLAGFLSLGIIYLISQNKKDLILRLALLTSIICLLLTFSLSAFIGLVAILLIRPLIKKADLLRKVSLILFSSLMLLSFLLPFVTNKQEFPLEVKERIEQANIAGKLFVKHPVLGTGLNTFSSLNLKLQPVHNIFLLVLVETGIAGLIFFVSFIYKVIKRNPSTVVCAVLIISFFDHYFISLQQNLLTLSIVFGTVFAGQKRLKLSRAK